MDIKSTDLIKKSLCILLTRVDGPSVVHVDTFTMTRGGTIGYQLTPKSGTGDYPQVFANTANLRGTLNPQFLPGFYANQTMYNDIVVAGTRNGTFDAVEGNSILLETQALYDGNTVDLKVTRTPFNKVAGLTKNQKAAGGGIEKVYSKLPGPGVDPSSTTPFAQLVANLFTVGSAGDYGQVLDQLAGSQYAQVLQSMLWSTRALNGAITDRMDCHMNVTNGLNVGPGGTNGQEGSPGSCFTPKQLQAWGRVWGGWNNNDGDQNAPAFDENQFGIWGGVDYAINSQFFAGVSGGYFDSNMDFAQWGGVRGANGSY